MRVHREWYSVIAPVGSDKAILARLNSEIVKALAVAEVKERLLGLGADIAGSTPRDYGVSVPAEINEWGAVVRAAGIKLE